VTIDGVRIYFEHLQTVTTSDHSAITNSDTLQFNRARTLYKSSQSAMSSPMSPASVLTFTHSLPRFSTELSAESPLSSEEERKWGGSEIKYNWGRVVVEVEATLQLTASQYVKVSIPLWDLWQDIIQSKSHFKAESQSVSQYVLASRPLCGRLTRFAAYSSV
jgi:hypothetical protein